MIFEEIERKLAYHCPYKHKDFQSVSIVKASYYRFRVPVLARNPPNHTRSHHKKSHNPYVTVITLKSTT